jgi:excisionase family DNA binding protein
MASPRRSPTFTPEIEGKTPRWASPAAGAAYAGISLRTMRDMISKGEITGYRLGPKLIRVDLNQIDAAMKPMNGWAKNGKSA